MTEYQKIENALIPLGWTPELRNGDHVRFTKEGITQYITVYKNITDKGRALQNAYAEIRRAEPRFPLGRQAHMLGGEETNTEPIVPEGVPSWMVPGRTVRWTAPEQRDWTKLSDPHSVMNKEYVINGFTGEGNEARVILFDPEHGIDFPVPQQDLDRWETAACERCGTPMPLNRLSRSLDGKVYCEDCVNRIILENNAAGKPAMEPPKEPARVEDPLKNLAELKNSQDARMRQLHDLFLESKKMDDMTPEQRQDYVGRVKEVIDKVSNSTKKSLRKKFPDLMAYFEDTRETTTPKTPYEAWKNALNDIMEFNIAFNPDGYDKDLEKHLKKALFGCSYTITQLRKPTDKRKTAARLVTINANDWDTTHRLWTGTEILFRQFREALPDLPLYILIHCPKAEFHQYAADTASCDTQEGVASSLLLLESMLPESERAGLTRAIGNLSLPYISEVHDELMRRAEAARINFKEGCGVKLEADTIDPDSDDYETAPPIYVATLLISTKDDPEAFRRLDAEFGNDKPLAAPVRVHIIDWYGNQKRTYGYNLEPLSGSDAGKPGEVGKDARKPDTRHLILGIYEDEGKYTVETMHDTLFDREKLVLTLCTATEDDFMCQVYRDALGIVRKRAKKDTAWALRWKELTGCDIRPDTLEENAAARQEQVTDKPLKTHDTMPQNDILDQFNPQSNYPFLATVSTRDLLKELKARGVSFDNLAITVKKAIDINDI